MSSMSSREVLNMPALGRQFFLGTLYDSRTDKIIEGVTFWDQKVLERKKERSLVNFTSTTIAEDTISAKTSNLNVNANLKLSILGGLIDIKGSGNYLNNRVTSSRQSRLTLSCTCTVKSEAMTMDDHLGDGKIKYHEVFDHDLATHVVTGVVYGGQAFFVFDANDSKDEKEQNVSGFLEAVIKKIPFVDISGQGDLKMEDEEKELANKFQCTYFGDYIPEENPTCFEDAIKLYRNLSKFFKNDTDQAKPVHVTLHPIALLNNKPFKMVRDISVSLVDAVDKALEELHECEVQCNDLLKYDLVQKFPEYQSKIRNFRSYTVTYKLEFQRKLCKVLPEIRGGGRKESELIDLLKDRESSPFSQHALEQWLKNVTCDVKVLSNFTTMLSDAQVASNKGDFYSFHMKPDVKHLLAFSIQVPVSDDHLNIMSKYLRDESIDGIYDPTKTILLEKEMARSLMEKARIFKDFLQENKSTPCTAFAVKIEPCSSLEYDVKIEYYHDGVKKDENYEVPTCPSKIWPDLEKVTHNSIRINWNPPSHGRSNVLKNKITYCKVGHNSNPKAFDVSSALTSETIENLESGCEYDISIQSVCDVGITRKCHVTVQTRPTSPPTNLIAYPLSKNEIEIEWSASSITGTNSAIEKYIIKKQQGNSDWVTTEFTTLEECRAAVTVSPKDIYRFKIHSDCGKAGISLDSEDSNEVRMYPEEILKAKLQREAEVLRNETPRIIKLKMTQVAHDQANRLQKLEYGCKKENIQEKVVMVVGTKRSGKTTFINGMINKALSVNWNDSFRLKMTQGVESKDPSKSQTQSVTSYTLHFEEGFSVPYSLTVIDTPGFDMGKPSKEDTEIMLQIHQFLKTEGIGSISHLDALYLMVPSSLPSSSSSADKREGFNKILSLFGQEVAENTHIIISFADGSQPNVIEDLKEANICHQKVVMINNVSLFACQTQLSSRNQNQWSTEYNNSDHSVWQENEKSYEILLAQLYAARSKCIGPTQNVLLKQNKFLQLQSDLWKDIHNSPNEFTKLMKKVEEALYVQVEKGDWNDFNPQIANMSNSKQVDLPEGEKVFSCPKCKFTCVPYTCMPHGSCPLKTVYCRFCPGKCHRDHHEFTPFRYEENWSQREEDDTDQLSRPPKRNKVIEKMVKEAENEFRQLQNEMARKLEEVESAHEHLNTIALRPAPFPGLEQIKSNIDYCNEAYKAYSVLVKCVNICSPHQ